MSNLSVKPFMSADDWKAEGPMGRMPRQPGAGERPGIYDDNIYDGGAEERVQAERPYQAHAWVGGANKVLGNPNHSYGMADHAASNSQFFHIMEVLHHGGKPALDLVREAAKIGNKAAIQAGELEGDRPRVSYAEASQALMDRYGAGTNGRGRRTRAQLSQDEIEQAASQAVSSAGMSVKASPNFTFIAPTTGTAKVLRAFTDTVLKYYPPETQFEGQKLPKSIDEVPLEKIAADFAKAGRPARFGSREDGRPTVGLFASRGMEVAAATWMSEQDGKLAVAPQKGELWKSLMEIDGRKHWRVKEFGAKDRNKGQMIESVVNGSDVVTVFWNGDERDDAFMAAAYAARQGKLAKVFDAEGVELNVYDVARDAKAAHMSKAEFARSQTLDAFSVPSSSPEGRLGLSLIRGKDGAISEKDVNRLAMIDMSINEISDLATTEAGREELVRQHRVTPAATAMLADDKVMANARTAYLRIRGHMAEHEVQLVGPENYPADLLASGKMPPYLFAKGDIEAFRNATNIVGVIGDRPAEQAGFVASRNARAIAALASSPATLAEVEGESVVEAPVNGPRILILSSGHGHVSSVNPAATMERRAEVIERGGVIISQLPPEESGSFYSVEKKSRESISSAGNAITSRQAASLLGAMSASVVVTQMDASQATSPTRSAVLAQLQADRRPTVANYNDLEGFKEVSGNRALLSGRGADALTRAGFGEADIQKLAPKFEGARVAIDSGPDLVRAMGNLTRHLSGEKLDLPKAKTRDRDHAAEL